MVNAVREMLGFKAKSAASVVLGAVFALSLCGFIRRVELNAGLVGRHRHNNAAFKASGNDGRLTA